jgi:flagellar biosynthesis/type III secretory pathway chaperone
MPRLGHAWLASALWLLPMVAGADEPGPTRAPASDPGTDAPAGPGARVPAAGSEGPAPDDAATLLREHLALLETKRLAPAPAESVDELDATLEEAQQLALAGSRAEAASLLLEAVEGPRFRSFESYDSFAAADLMLASLLLEQRALIGAQRSVDRLLARGVDSKTYGPAYRRAIDIALLRGDLRASAVALSRRSDSLPEDAASELRYLRGLAVHHAHDDAESERELREVSKNSRFYGQAQYLLGTIAARQKRYDDAKARFCAARDIVRGAPRSRYASAQRDATEDAVQLGLGRVAHEQGRDREALEHYFKVPHDSPQLAEALFEAAFASYERGHAQTAMDSLAQLEARFPRSPYTAEARVLRGYLHLARCDFERAERELVTFEQTFGAVLRELDATLASPQRTHGLFREHARDTRADDATHDGLLLGLVRRDPEVARLTTALAALEAELARSSRVGEAFGRLSARVRGTQLPTARASDEADQALDEQARSAKLRRTSAALHEALAGLARELRALRAGGARSDELAHLTRTHRALVARSDAQDAALRALVLGAERMHERPRGAQLAERLEQDRAYVEGVRSRDLRVRDQLEQQLSLAEQRALSLLRERLDKELRRARIGRIDAVMGQKRKLELEVESLAAGRFPPELSSQTPTSALLSDDEEYWPFEGESWSDEREEQP